MKKLEDHPIQDQFSLDANVDESTESDQLPLFAGVSQDNIYYVQTSEHVQQAQLALEAADVVGFDTESKPIFVRGQSSDGPHLLQLATDTHAYLFPLVSDEQVQISRIAIKSILESPTILKVGFGLRDDHQRLLAKLDVKVNNVLDLSRAMGESKKRQMGAKAGIAKYFGQTLPKSKRISTSNWASLVLNDKQLKYAADDAYSALVLYRVWSKITK